MSITEWVDHSHSWKEVTYRAGDWWSTKIDFGPLPPDKVWRCLHLSQLGGGGGRGYSI